MRLILIGCEYAGKTTLASKISKWRKETTSGGHTFHDYFTIPPSELPEAEQAASIWSPAGKGHGICSSAV